MSASYQTTRFRFWLWLINTADQPEPAYGMAVSGNYFTMLGVQPTVGRLFGVDEDRVLGGQPVAVISFGLWQSHFGADPAALGQIIKVNGHPFTIMGVTPKRFTSTYSVFAPALYMPLSMQAAVLSKPRIFGERMSEYLKLTGRIRPGVSREQAELITVGSSSRRAVDDSRRCCFVDCDPTVAFLACCLPAYRASRVDPMVALRQE